MRSKKKLQYRISVALLLPICMSIAHMATARMGGGGGGGSSSSGGGSYGGGGGYGGGSSPVVYLIALVIYIIYKVYQNDQKNARNKNNGESASLPTETFFPEGLDANKVAASFMDIQDAWQRKDLLGVRKWISDGMYQRLATQFKMMEALAQVNTLSNIRINNIEASNVYVDGRYQVAEIAISFTMDDSFTSSKYPQFNESYRADTATEYWTFIKRTDSIKEKNLYDNNNCPNCGAPFEVKMGEISRCSNCNTLTNSAAYDWVLSEITQQDEYTRGAGLRNDTSLNALMKDDPFFAVQRMEDIASNIFMQIMEMFTIGDEKQIARFADGPIKDTLLQQKRNLKSFVFDRLYLNSVTLNNFIVEDDFVKIHFSLKDTYRRVAITNDRLQMLDNDFVERNYSMELTRSKDALNKGAEIVYSYECSSCGAPYTDTTEDHCAYCDAPVIDKQRNWVLTGFSMI